MMVERRQFPRIPVSGKISYRIRRLIIWGRLKVGHLINLSEAGAHVGVFEPLDVGTRLKVYVPGESIGAPRLGTVVVRGKVVWWCQGEKQRYSTAGLEFARLPKKFLAAFRDFSARKLSEHLEDRMGVNIENLIKSDQNETSYTVRLP